MPVIAAYISRLPGHPGSHLEVTLGYPENVSMDKGEVLKITLPMGAGIDDYFEETLGGESVLVYTFHIPNEPGVRADLASIGLVYQKPTNKYMLKDVVGALFKFLHENDLVSVDILKENLPKIVDAINSEVKLTIQAGKKKTTFDIPQFIAKRNEEIVKPLKGLWG
ncbi:MAG: hypothetical protein GYA24_09980 [Candidatus Lokiarchaeota archaeon]|nr:hypothetical protein [Candidatus Lokiarchaeota archaeon]